MRDYVVQSLISRDMMQPIPEWMKRVQVWAVGEKFSVNCGFVPLEEATELLVEALLYVLKRRGREAQPIVENGEVRGMQWQR